MRPIVTGDAIKAVAEWHTAGPGALRASRVCGTRPWHATCFAPRAMSINAWLSVFFTLPTLVAYGLWCIERLPRLRRFMAVAGVFAFVLAVVVDGFFE